MPCPCRTSADSMALCVAHLQNDLKQKPALIRKKADVAMVEEVSLKAALCHNLAQELLQTMPVPPQKLAEVWQDSFKQGPGLVDSELQGLLMDRSQNLNLRTDIGTFRKLAEAMQFTVPVPNAPEMEVTLAQDKFALLKKQFEYDITVYSVWCRKVENLKVAAETAKHEWRLNRRKRSLQAAQTFVNTCLTLRVWDRKKIDVMIADLMICKRDFTNKVGCNVEDVSFVVYFNASAPCLIPAAVFTQQTALMSWCLNDSMKSIGLVIMPQFTHQRGKLCIDERTLLDRLATSGNHDVDWNFHILFNERGDIRDRRPMVYGGKLVFPSPLPLDKQLGGSYFLNSSISCCHAMFFYSISSLKFSFCHHDI